MKHETWLRKRGLSRAEVKAKKKQLGSPNTIPDYTTTRYTSDNIPANGTKSPDISKAEFAKKNYPMIPAYNKGPVMVISKDDVKYAGKK